MTPYKLIADSDAIYLDTCALVKIDAKEESGSPFTRALVYLSTVPVFSSFVGFGEFFSVIGKKKFQALAGAEGFLFCCRQLMIDFDMGKIQRAEPVGSKFEFITLADKLLPQHGHLGGGDVWHLMAALNLQSQVTKTTFVSFEPPLVQAALSEGLQAVNGAGLSAAGLLGLLKLLNKYIGQ